MLSFYMLRNSIRLVGSFLGGRLLCLLFFSCRYVTHSVSPSGIFFWFFDDFSKKFCHELMCVGDEVERNV